MFTLGIIAVIFALFMLHGAFVDAIKGPSNRAGGNPNAPGSYNSQISSKIYPPPPRANNGLRPSPLKWEREDGKRNTEVQSKDVYELLKVEPPVPPPAGKSYGSSYQEPPPRPQIVYLTDSDPTPPYGIPRLE